MRVAVLVPCYKRPEYTKICIEALERNQNYDKVMFFLVDDGSDDGTRDILDNANLEKIVIHNRKPQGLRRVLIDFFNKTRTFTHIAKVDNDCEVGDSWLHHLSYGMYMHNLDIVSPNVLPSNAAFKYGKESSCGGYRTAEFLGGVWLMKQSLVENIYFDQAKVRGIKGAVQIMKRIFLENEPRAAWLPCVEFQDIGHWSGAHPNHIKSEEHERYSAEVGRKVLWNSSEE